jgi:NADH:ubiquinone oxidoreductase subunit E
MEPERQKKIAFRLGGLAALLVLAGLAVLLADYAATVVAAPADEARVEELREQVRTDAAVAEALHAELDRQTVVSIARKERARIVAWILLAAGGLFVVCGKWTMSLRPQPLPVLDALVAERLAPGGLAIKGRSKPVPDACDARSFVDDLVARVGRNHEAAIPLLQEIQNRYRYLPDEALRRVCEVTDVTPAQIAGTSSFYAQFRRSPIGRYVVRVCHGTACHVAGAQQITQELRRHLQIAPGEDTDPQRRFTIDAVACVGCCSLAPVMMVEDEAAGRLTPARARQALDGLEADG